MTAVQLVGQIGVSVDLNHDDLRRIIDQAGHYAVGHGMFAAEGQEEPVSPRSDVLPDRREAVLDPAVGRQWREGMEPWGLGELHQRLLVEGFDL